MFRCALALAVLASLFGGCDAVPVPDDLQKDAGDGQVDTAGHVLAVPLSVRVVDAAGEGVADATVVWTTEDGAGSLSPDSGTTDIEGRTAAEWTLGTVAGDQSATAEIPGIASVRFTATALPAAISSLEIEPDGVLLQALGDSVRLQVAVEDDYGNPVPNAPVAWSTGDTTVVGMHADGWVTAQGNGSAAVVASAAGLADSIEVVVEQAPVAVSVTPERDSVPAGSSVQLAAEATDANDHPIADAAFTWHAADATVAAVDDSGRVTGLEPGATTIEATTGQTTGSALVTVESHWAGTITSEAAADRAVTDRIGLSGGTITAVGPGGATMTLTVPDSALLDPVEITLTPLATLHGLPPSAALVAGVRMEPEGLQFALPARLTLVPDGAPAGDPAGFGAANGGEGLHLTSVTVAGDTIAGRVTHFSEVGAAVGIVDGCREASPSGLGVAADAQHRINCLLNILVKDMAAGVRDGFTTAELQDLVAAFDEWLLDGVMEQLSAATDCWLTPGCGSRQGRMARAVHGLPEWVISVQQVAPFLDAAASDHLAGAESEAVPLLVDLFDVAIDVSEDECLAETDQDTRLDRANFLYRLKLWIQMLPYPELNPLEDPDPGLTCGHVDIQPDTLTLPLTGAERMAATVTDVFGDEVSSAPVTWSIANEQVAKVTGGLVEAVAPGSTWIAARSDKKVDTATVIVAPPVVTLDPPEFGLAVGDSVQVAVHVTSNGASVPATDITWSAEIDDWSFFNDTTVVVDPDGLVTGVRVGPGPNADGWVEVVATVTVAGHQARGSARVRTHVEFPDPGLDSAIRGALRAQGVDVDAVEPLTFNHLYVYSGLRVSAWKAGIQDLDGLQYIPVSHHPTLGPSGGVFLLSAQINDITDLSPVAAHASTLRWLNVQRNPVSDLGPVAGMERLLLLKVARTDISDLAPVAGLDSLEEIHFGVTAVADLSPLAAAPNLQEIWGAGTPVSDLTPLAGLSHLTHLDLGGVSAAVGGHANGITDLSPLAGLTALEYLDLSSSPVTDFSPLAGLVNLVYLDLSLIPHRGVDIHLAPFLDLAPLANLTSLEVLDLRSTKPVSVAPLGGLPRLQRLDLSGSYLEDVSGLANLPSLRWLDLSTNHICDISALANGTTLTAGDTVSLKMNRLAEFFYLAPEPTEGPTTQVDCGWDLSDQPALSTLVSRGVVFLSLNGQYKMKCRPNEYGVFTVPDVSPSVVDILTNLFPPGS